SLKLSGVTFTTPMTSGIAIAAGGYRRARDGDVGDVGRRPSVALVGADLDLQAAVVDLGLEVDLTTLGAEVDLDLLVVVIVVDAVRPAVGGPDVGEDQAIALARHRHLAGLEPVDAVGRLVEPLAAA